MSPSFQSQGKSTPLIVSDPQMEMMSKKSTGKIKRIECMEAFSCYKYLRLKLSKHDLYQKITQELNVRFKLEVQNSSNSHYLFNT